MANSKSKQGVVDKKNAVKIVINWDGKEGEGQKFKMTFTPDPLDLSTDIRKHLVVLANAFASGTKQLMSVIKPLPQPTEEELKNQTYDFALHGEEYGEGLFGLYNYKKAVMEEFVTIVERVLPDAFHDVLVVKGAQEKIFEHLREEHREREEAKQNEDNNITPEGNNGGLN